MNRARHLSLLLLTITWLIVSVGGCRAISRFGQSRQSIAARKLSRQGQKAMHSGDWTTAEALFTEALDVSESDDRAHWGLAESLWQRGDHDEAIKHMEQAVRLSADDPVLLSRLGRMYADVGRDESAHRQSHMALAADRNSAEIWTLRGDCLAAGRQWEEALSAYHRALAIQPDLSVAQLHAAEIYREQGRYDRLLASMDRMRDHLGSDQTPSRSDVLRGIAMRELGRSDEARRCFVLAAQKNPADETPHLQLASLALESGDVSAARTSLGEALRLNPTISGDPEFAAEFGDPQLFAALPPAADRR